MDIVVLVLICLLLTAAAYIFVPADKYKTAFIILVMVAITLRFAMVIYLYRNGTDSVGTDGLLYHRVGMDVAKQLSDGVPLLSVKYSYTWYTVFVGLVYHIFGTDRYIVSYINIAFAFISAILLLKIAINRSYTFKNAAFISLAFLYFPNLFLWTSDSRKEALLILICLACLYTVQSFMMQKAQARGAMVKQAARIVLVCFLLWFATLIRIYMFIPLAAAVLVSQFLSYLRNRRRECLFFMAAVLTVVVLTFLSTVYPLLGSYHAVLFPEQSSNVSVDISNKVETVKLIASNKNILQAAANYILLPYPGNVDIADIRGSNILESVVSMDMMGWYACLILMLSGVYSAIKRKESYMLGLLAFMVIYIAINVPVVENVSDTIYRYRSVIVGTSLLFIDWNIIGSLFRRIEGIPDYNKGAKVKASTISSFSIKNNM
ncbi:MAG TPA: hypothetical protein VHT96_09475 [Clostridia bacterium]|nr:hypothetical protein [Clostridia bacterium]